MNLRPLSKHEERKYDRKRARKRFEGIKKVHGDTIFRRDKDACQICGYSPKKHKLKPVIFENQIYTPPHLVIDHIRPLCRGGSNKLDNLQVLCDKCNAYKSTRAGNNFPTSSKHIRYMKILGYDIEKQELIYEQ